MIEWKWQVNSKTANPYVGCCLSGVHLSPWVLCTILLTCPNCAYLRCADMGRCLVGASPCAYQMIHVFCRVTRADRLFFDRLLRCTNCKGIRRSKLCCVTQGRVISVRVVLLVVPLSCVFRLLFSRRSARFVSLKRNPRELIRNMSVFVTFSASWPMRCRRHQ